MRPERLETEALRRKLNTKVIPLPAWTAVRRRLLALERPFDLTRHYYLAGLYNCTARRIVVHKASQLGASEYGISYTLWSMDLRKATALYVFPTAEDVSDFSSARFGPALEASEYLASRVVSGGGRGADRVRLKRIGNQFLYFRGARVNAANDAPQLKSMPIDVLILDEVDSMDDRAPAIARKRLGHSHIGEERDFSTPTYPNVGIHAMFQESDMREWFVKCPHCGNWQFMNIDDIVTDWDDLKRPVAWHGQDEDTAWVACRKCGDKLDRLARGQWVPQYPAREIAGFHLTKLFSPFARLLDIIRSLQTVNEEDRQQIYNQDLGEPYVPRGGGLAHADLDKIRRDYAHGPLLLKRPGRPERVLPSIAGVDIGNALNVVIREAKVGRGLQRRQLFAGALMSFEELGRLFKRYNVTSAVIDALPETKKVREFQAEYTDGEVFLCYYATQHVGMKDLDPVRINYAEGTVTADRTRTLDMMTSAILESYWSLPAGIRNVSQYYPQMCSIVRVLKKQPSGNQVARWVHSTSDHYAHAENYCFIATYLPLPTSLPGQQGLMTEGSEWDQ